MRQVPKAREVEAQKQENGTLKQEDKAQSQDRSAERIVSASTTSSLGAAAAMFCKEEDEDGIRGSGKLRFCLLSAG